MNAVPNQPDEIPPIPPADLYADVPGVLNDFDLTLLSRDDPDEIPEHLRDWRIDTADQAEWAMAKVIEDEATVARLKAQRNASMERAQDWFARTAKWPQAGAARLRMHLEDYALRLRAASRDTLMTTHLPNGKISTRKGSDPAVVITDEAAVLAWAKTHAPGIVTTVEKVNVTDLRKIAEIVPATDDGPATVVAGSADAGYELVPGTAISEPGEPTATVHPG